MKKRLSRRWIAVGLAFALLLIYVVVQGYKSQLATRYSPHLVKAVNAGDTARVQELLRKGADPNYPTGSRDDLLAITIRNHHPTIVKALLEHGADHYCTIVEEGRKLDAIMFAAQVGDPQTYEVIAAHENISDLNELFSNPIMRSNITLIKYFIAKGADVNAPLRFGQPALHIARKPEVVAFLISKGADPNRADTAKRRPLHCTHDEKSIAILLEHGADPCARDMFGNTPLHSWAEWDCLYEPVLRAILARGADLNARNNDGLTPLAVHNKCFPEYHEDRIQLLLKYGAKE